MLFNSINFISFFVVVVLMYYVIPSNKLRKGFLLLASYYFYANWNVAFLFILLYVTVFSYLLGKRLEKGGKGLLTGGIIVLLLPLLGFKYLNFLFSSVNDLIHLCGGTMEITAVKWLLPVGISFYTFIAVGYVVDVYKKKVPAVTNLPDYFLFVGFFPQIASGPIGRADSLLP